MKKNTDSKPYITEEEFNRIVVSRNSANPEDDSKGDSGVDEAVEAELGEHYREGRFETLAEVEDEDHGHGQVKPDQEKIQDQTSDQAHEGGSTWPDAGELTA